MRADKLEKDTFKRITPQDEGMMESPHGTPIKVGRFLFIPPHGVIRSMRISVSTTAFMLFFLREQFNFLSTAFFSNNSDIYNGCHAARSKHNTISIKFISERRGQNWKFEDDSNATKNLFLILLCYVPDGLHCFCKHRNKENGLGIW